MARMGVILVNWNRIWVHTWMERNGVYRNGLGLDMDGVKGAIGVTHGVIGLCE